GLVLFEPPFVINDIRPRLADLWPGIDAAVAAGDRTHATQLFLRGVGVPGLLVAIMRWLPSWRRLAAAANTLSYDGAIVKDYQRGDPLPRNRWASVNAPTLVLAGSKSPSWMQNSAQSLAAILPGAALRILGGQTHNVNPKVHAPIVAQFVSEAI